MREREQVIQTSDSPVCSRLRLELVVILDGVERDAAVSDLVGDFGCRDSEGTRQGVLVADAHLDSWTIEPGAAHTRRRISEGVQNYRFKPTPTHMINY